MGAAALFGWRVRARSARQSVVAGIDTSLKTGAYREAADASLAALTDTADADLRLTLRCRLARALAGLEEYASAERVCREAADAAPSSERGAEALIELARCLALEGAFDRSLELVGGSLTANLPLPVRVRRDLVAADVALARLRFDDAERALASAFAGEANGDGEAALGHARLQYLRGNFRQATAELSRLIDRIEGEDLQANTLYVTARALLEQEVPSPVEADQAISTALVLAHFPGLRAVVTACHAVVQAHFGNTAEAKDAIARAPGLTVSKRFAAEAHCLAGDALRKMGAFAEARKSYQQALGLDAGSLEALWGLGTCAQMMGMFEVAESYFKLCIEAAPEHFLGQRSEDAIET